jgi:hypothetical protein
MVLTVLNVFAVTGVFILCSTVLVAVGGSFLRILRISVPREFQITAALGLGTVIVSLATAISYRIGLSVAVSILVVLVWVASFILYLFIRYLIIIKNTRSQLRIFDRKLFCNKIQDFARSQLIFLIALGASFVLMLPVTRFGLTSWTAGTTDFRSYVASAVIWLEGAEPFGSQQNGYFEAMQQLRAKFEKPIATGFLTFLVKTSELAPHQLLSVYVWIPLLLLLASLFSIHSLVSKVQRPQHLAAIIAVAGSSIPMSRLYDAQPGQVLMVALTSFGVLLFLIAHPSGTTLVNMRALPFIAGVTFATAQGANSTLFLGAAPTILAFLVWSLTLKIHRKNFWSPYQIWGTSLFAFFLTVTPFLNFYVWSFKNQSSGLAGFDIPLILPSDLFGLQPSYATSLELLPKLVFWALSLTMILILLISKRNRGFSPTEWILALTIGVNFSFFVVLYGINSYNTGKYLTILLSLIAPILIAKFLDLVIDDGFLHTLLPVILATLSLTFTLNTNVKSIPAKLWPKLQELKSPTGSINIIADQFSSSLIATSLPKIARVRIVERTIGSPSMPDIQSPFIVDRYNLYRGGFFVKKELAPGYFLVNFSAEIITPRIRDKIVVSSNSPDSDMYLSGDWSQVEDWGIWSTGPQAVFSALLPKDKGAANLEISIDAFLYTPEKESNSLNIIINDGLIEREFSVKDLSSGPIQLFLSSDEILALGDILKINLEASRFISPSKYGSSDGRSLGVALRGIDFKWKLS